MTASELRCCHLWKLYGDTPRESNTSGLKLDSAATLGAAAGRYWLPKSSGETESMNSLNCSTTSSAFCCPATETPSVV